LEDNIITNLKRNRVGGEMYGEFRSEYLKARVSLEDQAIEGRRVLKWIVREAVWEG
jgi:hypothetical protein